MEKPKVLILYNKLFHYRIPIWNILAEKCDLTVAYSQGSAPDDSIEIKFKVLNLPSKTFMKRFVIQKSKIRKLVKDYDVVIAYGDISWIKYSTLPWFNKLKVIFWTLGVSASYDLGYDQRKTWDKIRAFFYKKADALAFYTQYPIEKYAQMGFSREKMFEVPNTVAVYPNATKPAKDSILFIGTLYRQKGIQYLLDAYLANRNHPNAVPLNIIGQGEDFEYINEWIKSNNLEHLIKLRGAIYTHKEKSVYFESAYACVSPLQAGLSVLESMGYGVPFITTSNAITGGEIFNIHNQTDGILMENPEELTQVIKDIFDNSDKYLKMGVRAQQYYNANRTPNHMAQGLWDAIQFVLSKK